MKKLFLLSILFVATTLDVVAAYSLVASQVTIQDLTTDKDNFFVTVKASTSNGEYEVAFDLWPAKHSAIGTFNASDKTIGYVSSYVHKTKANGNAVNMWYYPEEDSSISLTITNLGDGQCSLTGSITASRNNVAYTYNIASFTFAYSETETPDPPQEDPYRFEPTTPTTVNFVGDVVNFRERDNYIEVTLNEIANETYDWIELRLLSNVMAMPAGTYAINTSGDQGSLTASQGYLGSTKGDDPCYVAIRADKEDWGQYTPYYLVSGSITVSYNTKTDTIFVTGTALSHNGSTINIQVKSYNMLYDPYDVPPEPEKVTLDIDTVLITYRSDLSDSTANNFLYIFDFFSSQGDYPNVQTEVILNQPMKLVAGVYTLNAKQLENVLLFQNQSDFNTFFYGGQPYVWDSVALTLKEEANGRWRYTMFLTDNIGSEYDFTFVQDPRIILYPDPSEDPKDKPYADELKEPYDVYLPMDSIVWKDETVQEDGILDIYLFQRTPDANGLYSIIQLGMYTPVSQPAAGTYPVNNSEAEYTFNASYGKYGNTAFPCYAMLIDEEGWAHAVWYIVSGSITLSYDEAGRPIISGDCTSYFGSTIRFSYTPSTITALDQTTDDERRTTNKVLRNGVLYWMHNGAMYNMQGQKVN